MDQKSVPESTFVRALGIRDHVTLFTIIKGLEGYEELDEVREQVCRIFSNTLLQIPRDPDGIIRVGKEDRKRHSALTYYPNGLLEARVDGLAADYGPIVLPPYETELKEIPPETKKVRRKRNRSNLSWISMANLFVSAVVHGHIGKPYRVSQYMKVPVVRALEIANRIDQVRNTQEGKDIQLPEIEGADRLTMKMGLWNACTDVMLQRNYLISVDRTWDNSSGYKYVIKKKYGSQFDLGNGTKGEDRHRALWGPTVYGGDDRRLKVADLSPGVVVSKRNFDPPNLYGTGHDRRWYYGLNPDTCSHIIRWPSMDQAKLLAFLSDGAEFSPYGRGDRGYYKVNGKNEKEISHIMNSLENSVDIPCSEDYTTDKEWFKAIQNAFDEGTKDDPVARRVVIKMGVLEKSRSGKSHT